jgi:hypothetical protein
LCAEDTGATRGSYSSGDGCNDQYGWEGAGSTTKVEEKKRKEEGKRALEALGIQHK